MAGVKGRSGGARPGAGRKRQDTIVMQANRRDVVLMVITEAKWKETVEAWLEMAKETPSVIYPLLPYLLGGAKQEINVSGRVDHTLTIETIRQAIGIAEVKPMKELRSG
jgi:hypothetical protein